MNLLIDCDEYGNYYHLLKMKYVGTYYLKSGGNGGPQIEQFHSIAVSNIKSIFVFHIIIDLNS